MSFPSVVMIGGEPYLRTVGYVWDTGTLNWVVAQQAGASGGGAATIANGADVAQGTTTDVAWVSGAGTVISLLKKIASAGGSAVSVADGADVAQGTTTDAEATGNGSVIALLKRLRTLLGGTLAVSAVALPLPAGAATDTTLTGGTAKAIARGGAKGTTAAADITSTASGLNHNAGDVILYDAAGNVVDPRTIRALTATDIVTAAQGAANATPWNENIAQFGGAAVATGAGAGGAGVPRVTVSNDSSLLGTKTHNAAAPGATNFGVLNSLANAAAPALTEANLVALSQDLAGALRVAPRPIVVLGAYRLAVQTGIYTALAAGSALAAFRWGDATRLCVITRVQVRVNTTTAATAAGMIDRDLVMVRGWTVSDSGGTAIALTTNNQKARTAHGTSLVTSMQAALTAALTKGAGTEDAQAIGLMTKQGGATEPVGITLSNEDLFLYDVGQNYPLVLAQNEGVRIRIPTAMPTSIQQRTTVLIEWLEVATF